MDTTADPSPAAGDDAPDLFQSLFGAYPDGLLVSDAGGIVRMANGAAARMLGYRTDELVGLPVDALVPERARPHHAEQRASYVRAPRRRAMGTDMELVARRKDGSEVMIEIGLSAVDVDGVPLILSAIRDVSTYPRVQNALRRARHADYLAQMGRLVVDTRDARLLLQLAPELACEALAVDAAVVFLLERERQEFRVAGGIGLLPAEAVGTSVPNLPDSPAGYMLARQDTLVVADYRAETRFAVPPAQLQAGLRSALATPIKDRGRIIGAFVVRSRTPGRFDAEDARFLESMSSLLGTSLQRAQGEEALNHAARLESVGQLTGGIAHDFNNLLTVILGNLQVLDERPALGGDAYGRQLAAAATRAARRGAELTGKLLAFSRRQVLQARPLDVCALVQSLVDMLRRTVDQRIVIEAHVDAACPRVMADPGQLESALLNLAINARDAMPGGGTLGFRAASCPALPARARSDLDDPSAPGNGFIAISVTDTGCGMPDAVKERAFEPFFTTKEPGRGTGLGLSTVYGFAKQSRGAVTIDSAPGQGTTMTLYLPRVQEAVAPAGGARQVVETLPPGLHVLVVEDDRVVSEVARAFLKSLGCTAAIAYSAEQALLMLSGDGEARFDVLMTDVSLGLGMRGTELARVARTRYPRIALLLVSGYSAEHLDQQRESLEGLEFVRKPYRREDLARAISRALLAVERR